MANKLDGNFFLRKKKSILSKNLKEKCNAHGENQHHDEMHFHDHLCKRVENVLHLTIKCVESF